MSYHLSNIPKGTLGEASKITEEYLEFIDSLSQGNKVMSLLELSDLLGAIEKYAENFGFSLRDLEIMKCSTERAFISGARS